jgi:hypothetical protein
MVQSRNVSIGRQEIGPWIKLGVSLRKSRVGVGLSLPTAASLRTEEVILGICRSVLGLQGTRLFPRLRS